MTKVVIMFLVMISISGVAGFSYFADTMPPTEREMYALTAKRDTISLYNLYSDKTYSPDIRKFAINQYIFLIEEDDKAQIKIEKEFVANRDNARSAGEKLIYQFGLSRLNQTLIEEQEKALLIKAIDIVAQRDTQGNIHVNPAKTLSSSPSPSIGVDLLMITEKIQHDNLPGSKLVPLKFRPDFSGLSASEITQLASTIDKVGVIISSSYSLGLKLEGCAEYFHASRTSLFAIALKTSELLTSHSLINETPTENTTIIDPSHADCISAAKRPEIENYFKITKQRIHRAN